MGLDSCFPSVLCSNGTFIYFFQNTDWAMRISTVELLESPLGFPLRSTWKARAGTVCHKGTNVTPSLSTPTEQLTLPSASSPNEIRVIDLTWDTQNSLGHDYQRGGHSLHDAGGSNWVSSSSRLFPLKEGAVAAEGFPCSILSPVVWHSKDLLFGLWRRGMVKNTLWLPFVVEWLCWEEIRVAKSGKILRF